MPDRPNDLEVRQINPHNHHETKRSAAGNGPETSSSPAAEGIAGSAPFVEVDDASASAADPGIIRSDVRNAPAPAGCG